MKPEQFIREYGLDKARDLLDQLHKLGCPDDMKITVINGMWQRTSNGFTYPELKRLVESVDLVESWGGIEDLKLYDLSHCKDKPESAGYKLLQAIADYESIYGGGDDLQAQ
ncbi:hypothetical protein [Acinetobacter baumannii]|uniref:hypothetical protein n=1 Tax=Acinetobacter baumannii TaxID=470 RepID=UPI0018873067|nr:hypothetical protein [Acinetobacter baumannii]MBF1851394.1 hypothetical protein [Acinetobacter baumannii]MCJ9556564.1 hypothetical protein [Acinetobacter baumannii]HAV5681808.1 hypothetical protein [Acinetobacter baumannii]